MILQTLKAKRPVFVQLPRSTRAAWVLETSCSVGRAYNTLSVSSAEELETPHKSVTV